MPLRECRGCLRGDNDRALVVVEAGLHCEAKHDVGLRPFGCMLPLNARRASQWARRGASVTSGPVAASRPRSVEERTMKDHPLYPLPSGETSRQRRELAPEIDRSFQEFSRAVFKAGALDAKTKQLIAVAVAHVTQCPYCIRGHTRSARREGAVAREIMEAIWVAAEMRAGGAFAHSAIALDVMEEHDGDKNEKA